MSTIQSDQRSVQRRTLDDAIAAEPMLPPPEIPDDFLPITLESFLAREQSQIEGDEPPTNEFDRTDRAQQVADRNSTHLAGEYFVAAELYRRGYSVAITLGNAKAIDLFAERDARAVNVQVKAIRNKKSGGWPMMLDRVKDDIVYVFVCLNDPGISPDFYLCTSAETREKVRQYPTRGIIQLGSLKSDDYFGRWEKIDAAMKSRA